MTSGTRPSATKNLDRRLGWPELRLAVQVTAATEVLFATALDSVRATNTGDHQTTIAAPVCVGPAYHGAALLLHDHPARRAAEARLGNVRLEDLDPLAAVEAECAGVRVGQRAHEASGVVGGPVPVDQTVALGTLVEVRPLGLVLRSPDRGAGVQRGQRFGERTRYQIHAAQHQFGAGVGGADRQ